MFIDTDKYLDRVYVQSPTPKIPYTTHRIWLTDPADPSEMLDVIVWKHSYERVWNTNRVLEESTGQKWTHYLWVLDRNLIPRTCEYFEAKGFVIRDMKELSFWNSDWKAVFDHYLEGGLGVGVAADIGRLLVMHELGGFYFDIDAYLLEWPAIVHHYFDMYIFAETHFDYRVAANWAWAQRAGHEISARYIETFLTNFKKPRHEKPFYMNECQGRTAGSTMYTTGVNAFAIAYYELNNINGNQDVLIKDSSPDYIPYTDTEFRTGANETHTMRVNVRVAPMGSWTRDFNDIQIFGWPELL